MKWLGPAALLLWLLPEAGRAEPVELELVLAVDASASVNTQEFDIQMTGLALAFRDPEVLSAIEAIGPRGLAVLLVTWSDEHHQFTSAPWHHITDAASADAFALSIARAVRQDDMGATAIGEAIDYAAWSILNNAYEGRRRVIDVSSDGRSNRGEKPVYARDRAVALGMVVNGLVIENEEPFLFRYFNGNVIGGTGAFCLSAPSYADYGEAIRLKLIREINAAPVAALTGGQAASN